MVKYKIGQTVFYKKYIYNKEKCCFGIIEQININILINSHTKQTKVLYTILDNNTSVHNVVVEKNVYNSKDDFFIKTRKKEKSALIVAITCSKKCLNKNEQKLKKLEQELTNLKE